MRKFIALSKVAEINPPTPVALYGEDMSSFVGMEAVDEVTADISRLVYRPYHEVAKGYTVFAENDVLLAKITPCMENGKCAIARRLKNGLGFGSTEFHVVRCSPAVLPEWVYYFWRLKQTRENAERNMTGSAGQRRVPSAFLEDLQIPDTPIDQQTRLVRLLSDADSLCRKRRHALKMCDELLPATFLELFGDLGTNNHGWHTKPLGQLIVAGPQNGLYQPSSAYGTGTRILRIDAFQNGRLVDEKALKRVRLSASDVSRYQINANDIIINRVNSRSHLGKSLLVSPLSEVTVFESNMMRFSVDMGSISPAFLVHQLQSPYINRQIQLAAKDAVNQASINQDDVQSFDIRVPPLDLQKKYEKVVGGYTELRATHVEALRQAEHLFQSLLHQAFNLG